MRTLLIGISLLSLFAGGLARADRASTHYHKAMALKRQGKIDEAIAAMRQALEARNDYAAAHRSIGVLYRQRKQYGPSVLQSPVLNRPIKNLLTKYRRSRQKVPRRKPRRTR